MKIIYYETITDVYDEGNMRMQDMYTATPEQFNNPDHNPDESIGLEDQSLILAPTVKVGTTTLKATATVVNQGVSKVDDVVLNAGIKTDNYLKNNVHVNTSEKTIEFLNGFDSKYPKINVTYPYINWHTTGYITRQIIKKTAE